MKQLVCEMCGGTDLIKQDGVFVCRSCGCKYTPDDAKKLMIDGPVKVTGEVKVDMSDRLSNLYQIARRAKKANDAANGITYYNMILVDDPTSWEASFYVVYFRAISCKIAEIKSALTSLSNCIPTVLRLIRNNVPKESQASAVKEVAIKVSAAAEGLSNGAGNHYIEISPNIRDNYKQEYIDRICAARDLAYTCGDLVVNQFGRSEKITSSAVTLWKTGISIHKKVLPDLGEMEKKTRLITDYTEKIGCYDPAYLKGNPYSKAVKDKELQISLLRGKINRINTPKQIGTWIGLGIAWIVIGVFSVSVCGEIEFGLNSSTFYIAMIIGGIGMTGWGLYQAKENRGKGEQNKKELAEAKKLLQQRQKELDELLKK